MKRQAVLIVAALIPLVLGGSAGATWDAQVKEAKAAALAMAKGDCGDYCVAHPIEHLNGLAANLLDREQA